MHLPGSTRRRPRSLLVIVAALIAATGPAALAGAEEPTAGPDDRVSEAQVSGLVADMLTSLGVGAERVDLVAAEVAAGVADRLRAMVDGGVVAVAQVDELDALYDDGDGGEVLAATGAFVETTRQRRDAFRDATRAVLAELGIDVPDDARLEDVLVANDLTLDDLRDLLATSGVPLPPPRALRADPVGDYPTVPDTVPAPAAYPTNPPPPPAPPVGPYPDAGPTLGDPPPPPPPPSAETDEAL